MILPKDVNANRTMSDNQCMFTITISVVVVVVGQPRDNNNKMTSIIASVPSLHSVYPSVSSTVDRARSSDLALGATCLDVDPAMQRVNESLNCGMFLLT